MATMGEQTENAGGSEYKGRYREYDVRQTRVAPFKPDDAPVAVDARMETSTTNRRDYQQHPLQRQAPMKPTDNDLKGQGDLDFSSSYNTYFQGHTGERARPIRHDRQREELEKFVGEPTYKAEFQEWSVQPRERRAAQEWKPSSAKMDDTTTNRADYKEQRNVRRLPVKPTEELSRSEVPFAGETGYRETFKEHKIQPRVTRPREHWVAPSVKFNHQTTKQSDFTGPYQPKRDSCRPDRAAFMSDAPFASDTTNRHDFQQKPLGQRHFHKHEGYVKPEGNMDLITTTASQFREPGLDGTRQPVEKPGSSHILRGTGPMEGKSGYNSDFSPRANLQPRRELMRPRATYEPSKEKFEGESVAKSDFVAKDPTPRENYRPTWEPLQSQEPFQSSTENRVSFQEPQLQPRKPRVREVYQAPSVPFKATTTNKESFQGQFVPKRDSFKPTNTAAGSDAKFEDSTTFGADFKPHAVSPRSRHQPETYVPPEGKMEMSTSNQNDFRDFGQVSRHVITKPDSSHVLRGEGKFSGSSSYTGDFMAPPPQQRNRAHAKSDYSPPSEKFDHVPTYQASFTGAFAPRQTSFRPVNQPLQNLNGFQDNPRPQPWQNASPQVPPMSV